MVEKRMLIVPAELAQRIDDNRGDMSQAEFIEFLMDNRLKEEKENNKGNHYVTKEEIRSFEQEIKKLLRNFLDFFVSYGLDLGKQSPKAEFEQLSSKLQELENELGSEGEKGKATIKWK